MEGGREGKRIEGERGGKGRERKGKEGIPK